MWWKRGLGYVGCGAMLLAAGLQLARIIVVGAIYSKHAIRRYRGSAQRR
jgi:hypothetical protein